MTDKSANCTETDELPREPGVLLRLLEMRYLLENVSWSNCPEFVALRAALAEPLPSESGERFLGENDYRERIEQLEALLREARTYSTPWEHHNFTDTVDAALAEPAPKEAGPWNECPRSWCQDRMRCAHPLDGECGAGTLEKYKGTPNAFADAGKPIAQELAQEWKGRADDAGRLAREVLRLEYVASRELPAELYDGMAVHVELGIERNIPAKHVSEVLDALVRIIRRNRRSSQDGKPK